jgi:hypothetical protein
MVCSVHKNTEFSHHGKMLSTDPNTTVAQPRTVSESLNSSANDGGPGEMTGWTRG